MTGSEVNGPGGRTVRLDIDDEWLGLETMLPVPLIHRKDIIESVEPYWTASTVRDAGPRLAERSWTTEAQATHYQLLHLRAFKQ